MQKKLIFITLIILILMPFTYAANDFAYNRLYDGTQPIDGFNYSINVNSSENWITNIGSLSDVNATQFNNIAGALNIDESWVDSLWCRLTGCTMTGDLTFSNAAIQNPNYIQFNTTWADGSAEGRLQWGADDGTLEVGMPGGEVNLQIGQEMLVRAKNVEGVDMTNCQAVWISGASGNRPEVMLPIASNVSEAPLTFGLATENITNNQLGYVTITGLVRDCDTSTWSDGDVLYLSETEEGNLTNIPPVAPNTKVIIGIVIRSSVNEGIIATNPVVVQRLITSSDVYPVGLQGASILRYNSTSNRFEISTSYTTDETDELVGGASLELYFKNTTSGISTYWDMNQSANDRPKNTSTITLSADSTEIGGFVSANASDLGIAGLDEGIIDSHFHASVDSTVGKKTVAGYFEVYQRYDNGTEIFLARSHLIEVGSTSETEYEAHASLFNEVVLNDSDRIVMKLFANLSGSGGNPVLTTYIQGDTLARGDFSSLGVNFLTKGQADRDYFRLDGTSAMEGNADWSGYNLSNVGDLIVNYSITLNDTTIEDWDEIVSNVSINYGANESNTSGPEIPFLLTEEGILKIEAVDPVASTIWSQVVSEIRNVAGNILNFSGSMILSGNADFEQNITVEDKIVYGSGAYRGWNATCQIIDYASDGSVIAAMGCT